MKSQDRLKDRLRDMFRGLLDATPRTGSLTFSGPAEKQIIHGWVWECDERGAYKWCSPEVERFLGVQPAVLIGQSLLIMETNQDKRTAFMGMLQSGKPIENFRFHVRDKDGEDLELLLNALPRTSPEGERLGYRGVNIVLKTYEEEEPVVEEKITVTLPKLTEEISAAALPALPILWGSAEGYIDDGTQIRSLDPIRRGVPPEEPSRTDTLRIPIQLKDTVLGVMEFDHREDDTPWTAEDAELARAVAQDLAVALQDARTHMLTQKALDEMREVDRLKSQFLANMSHELRTPLNSIIGFSSVILKGIDGPINETQMQDLTAIHNAGLHLLSLINDILDVSRIEAGKMELTFTEVDLREIIAGVMTTATGLVKDKPIELVTEVRPGLPKIKADSVRIRQVLLNLISNASKFTERGHIGISAREHREPGRYEVLIAVFDTGPGIEPEDQERLFEPFTQVDASPTRRTGGSGLGLSICRHLVELHGGRIWVESVPGEGSTFAFTLPVDPLTLGSALLMGKS